MILWQHFCLPGQVNKKRKKRHFFPWGLVETHNWFIILEEIIDVLSRNFLRGWATRAQPRRVKSWGWQGRSWEMGCEWDVGIRREKKIAEPEFMCNLFDSAAENMNSQFGTRGHGRGTSSHTTEAWEKFPVNGARACVKNKNSPPFATNRVGVWILTYSDTLEKITGIVSDWECKTASKINQLMWKYSISICEGPFCIL